MKRLIAATAPGCHRHGRLFELCGQSARDVSPTDPTTGNLAIPPAVAHAGGQPPRCSSPRRASFRYPNDLYFLRPAPTDGTINIQPFCPQRALPGTNQVVPSRRERARWLVDAPRRSSPLLDFVNRARPRRHRSSRRTSIRVYQGDRQHHQQGGLGAARRADVRDVDYRVGVATERDVGRHVLEIRRWFRSLANNDPPARSVARATSATCAADQRLQTANGAPATPIATTRRSRRAGHSPTNCASVPTRAMQGACGFTARAFRRRAALGAA